MRIAFFETEDWEQKYFEEKLKGNELQFFPHPLGKEDIAAIKDVDALSVFINSPITEEVVAQLPNIKLITTRSTGFDHIDLSIRKKKDIIVCNVPHYGTHTVAEHTFALILGLSRKLYHSFERTKHGEFDHSHLTGFDLYNKTLGIIGMGDIGTSVIHIAKGFGMHVVAFSRHPDEKVAKKLGITFLNFNELLAASDIVSLHVPYNKETHHIINKKNIKKFKKGSLLINTARGALVQTEAIVYGLEKGILQGAGLDVLEEENLIQEERQILSKHFKKTTELKNLYFDHVLMNDERTVITPHNAFNSIEALHIILDTTIENIVSFAKHTPQNMVES